MITCQLWNGLGNQLFMMAATMAHAWRNNDAFAFPAQTLRPELWERKLPHLPTLPDGWKHSGVYDVSPLIEKNFVRKAIIYEGQHYEVIHMGYGNGMCLSGYFQTEKYFWDYRDRLLKEFGFKWQHEPGVVAVHVRRGDYLEQQEFFPVVTPEYLLKAMEMFHGKTFRFYSDDIDWCKGFCRENNIVADFSDRRTEIEDLESMSGCEHQICSNSTFAWWAYWLNQSPDKTGVFPAQWYGPANKWRESKDIYPENAVIV